MRVTGADKWAAYGKKPPRNRQPKPSDKHPPLSLNDKSSRLASPLQNYVIPAKAGTQGWCEGTPLRASVRGRERSERGMPGEGPVNHHQR